jgi:hypothetical protein
MPFLVFPVPDAIPFRLEKVPRLVEKEKNPDISNAILQTFGVLYSAVAKARCRDPLIVVWGS